MTIEIKKLMTDKSFGVLSVYIGTLTMCAIFLTIVSLLDVDL